MESWQWWDSGIEMITIYDFVYLYIFPTTSFGNPCMPQNKETSLKISYGIPPCFTGIDTFFIRNQYIDMIL